MSAVTSPAERNIRQRDVLDPEVLQTLYGAVIGVGAVGRQVALQLAAIGVGNLSLWDFDEVAPENLAAQGYRPDQLGEPKVTATGADCVRTFPELKLHQHPGRFKLSEFSKLRDVLRGRSVAFCCVDSIQAREQVATVLSGQVDLWVDARLAGPYTIRVLTEAGLHQEGPYFGTLFGQEEAYRAPCTSKMTIFSANIAAGLMLAQLSKWLRGMPIEPDTGLLNLLSMEFIPLGR